MSLLQLIQDKKTYICLGLFLATFAANRLGFLPDAIAGVLEPILATGAGVSMRLGIKKVQDSQALIADLLTALQAQQPVAPQQ